MMQNIVKQKNDIKTIINKLVQTEKLYNERKVFINKCRKYTFVNPYGYHILRKNLNLYNSMDGIFVDGILMCLLVRLFYGVKLKRHSFDYSSIAKDFFNHINETQETLFLVGANNEEINLTVSQIRKEFPNINIIGYRNGYFKNDEERKICIENIIKQSPDFVVVGMGALLQERFVLDLYKFGYAGISFTCGGYLRQASTGIDYYPTWINRFNLRAFYRLYKEKGLYGRLKDVFIGFPVLFFYDSFIKRK